MNDLNEVCDLCVAIDTGEDERARIRARGQLKSKFKEMIPKFDSYMKMNQKKIK